MKISAIVPKSLLQGLNPHKLYHTVPGLEATMPKVSLSRMTVEALMDLRKRVDETLHKRRAELERQLERIAVASGARVVRGEIGRAHV